MATLLWAFSHLLPFQSDVTVYNMFCTGGLSNGKCSSKEETANPSTYRALADQQTVLYWNSNTDAPKRLQHCAVRDTRNWSCQLEDKLEESPKIQWQMVGGEFREVVEKPFISAQSIFYAVPKWYWWWVRLSEYRS